MDKKVVKRILAEMMDYRGQTIKVGIKVGELEVDLMEVEIAKEGGPETEGWEGDMADIALAFTEHFEEALRGLDRVRAEASEPEPAGPEPGPGPRRRHRPRG